MESDETRITFIIKRVEAKALSDYATYQDLTVSQILRKMVRQWITDQTAAQSKQRDW